MMSKQEWKILGWAGCGGMIFIVLMASCAGIMTAGRSLPDDTTVAIKSQDVISTKESKKVSETSHKKKKRQKKSATPKPKEIEPEVSDRQARLNAVVKILDKMGCGYEMPRQGSLNVVPPDNVAMDMTERQARELAILLQSKLGNEWTVRIKTPAGQTIGKSGW
jgi:hypothetical protein